MKQKTTMKRKLVNINWFEENLGLYTKGSIKTARGTKMNGKSILMNKKNRETICNDRNVKYVQ